MPPVSRETFKDSEVGHLIGSPVVVVDRTDDGAKVWLHNRPWGWQQTEREFLNPDSPSIDLFVQKQLARIRLEGEREAARKERKREAKRREAQGGGE